MGGFLSVVRNVRGETAVCHDCCCICFTLISRAAIRARSILGNWVACSLPSRLRIKRFSMVASLLSRIIDETFRPVCLKCLLSICRRRSAFPRVLGTIEEIKAKITSSECAPIANTTAGRLFCPVKSVNGGQYRPVEIVAHCSYRFAVVVTIDVFSRIM